MSDDRPQRTTYEENSPYVTSDANQQQRLTAGLGVVEGFEITAPASEGGLTAEIASGVAWMGERVSVAESAVSFESDDSDPRKIVIYVDGTGDIEVAQGDPAPPKPAGKSGRLTYQPVAPALDGVEAVVLWEGYIPPGATAASDDMFGDRRDESRISVDTVEAAEASVEEAPEAETDVARKAETDALDAAKADTPHDLAGDDHSEDTLENLNSKISDADLATDPHGNENHDPDFAEDPHGEESHTAEVLHDGQNFDGEGQSEFSNVESIGLNTGTVATDATDPNDIPNFGQLQEAGTENLVQQDEPEVGSVGTLWTRFVNPFKFSTDDSIGSGIAVSDGLVFAGSDDNNLYAINIADGTEEWSFSTGGSIESGIAVSDGLVFAGSRDNNLYAINISDGTEEWSFSADGGIISGIAVSDGLVFAGSDDNNLYAINTSDGTEEWSFSADDSIQSGIAVSDGLVFAGSRDNNLYAINISDGTEEWSFSTGDLIISGIAVSDGLVFAGSGDNNLYAINISDGTEEWSFSTGGLIASGIAVSDGLVFAGSGDNNLYAINIADGTEEWSFSAGSSVNSGITVSDGLVFAGSSDNNLYAIDSKVGVEEWSFLTGDQISSSIAVSDGLVFAGSGDNNLYGRVYINGSGRRSSLISVSDGDNWVTQT